MTAPPIEIYHPAFATFRTKAAAGIDHTIFNPQDLNLAYDLVVNSADIYKNEDERKKNLSSLGNFVHFDILAKLSFPTGKSAMEPDGTILRRFRANVAATLCFTELKNEIGEGGCDPMRQAEIDYVCFYSAEQVRLFFCPGLM